MRLRSNATGTTDSGAIRTETFRGREYTVVPVVALVEGIVQGLNALQGECASADEFAKYPVTWNGRPVTLNHPTANGTLVSANDPVILEEFQIGFLANTYRDDDKLKTEAWLDEELITELGADDMLTSLKAGEEHTEVSTGLFTDTIASNGKFNGKTYAVAWSGVVPDHLAFLPDSIGACSVADGCGAPRLNAAAVMATPVVLGTNTEAPASCGCQKGEHMANNQEGGSESGATEPTGNGTTEAPGSTGEGQNGTGEATDEAGTSGQVEATPEAGDASSGELSEPQSEGTSGSAEVTTEASEDSLEALERNEQQAQMLERLVANTVPSGMTFENVREIVQRELRTLYGANDGYSDCGCYHYRYLYILGITTDMVAFERWVRGSEAYETVAVSYSVDENGGVTFTGEPVPVNLITQIVPKPDASASAEVTANEGASGANQQQEEEPMAGTTEGGQTPATETTAEGQAGGENQVNGAGSAPAASAEPVTLESYLEAAPPEMREMLEEGISLRNQRRKKLTDGIVTNSQGLFTEEDLTGKTMEELQKLNTLSAPKQDFTGRVVPTGRVEGINVNSADEQARQNSVPPAPKAFPGRTMADTTASSSGSEA